jgi:predicted Zn-dependent peptidase
MRKIILLWGLIFFQALVSSPQERFRKSPPFPDPLQPLQLPAIESVRLSNDLTVAVVYQKDLPFISLELVVLAGESSSPAQLPGLATLTSDMLSRGTPLVSASEIEERIEAIGGTFSAATSLDYARFSFLFLDEYLDQALEVLSLMLLQPAFPDREIVNLKRTERYDIRQKQREPEFVGRRQLLWTLFNNHPYQRYLYNENVINNIGRDDIQTFFNKYYRPNNSILVLTGNLNLNIASRKVSQYLNTWQKKDVERPLLPPLERNNTEKVLFVDLPQAKDATLFVGNVIFPVGDPDFFPFAVLNQVLGGTPNSRLFMNLRESREYAYFAFSEMELFRSCGVYRIRAKVIPSACYASVQEILKELGRMTKEKVPTFEIEQAKSYLIGSFPLQVNKADSLTRRISEIAAFYLGEEYWNKFYDNIQLVDSGRVFEVAEKYLLPKPVVIIVGDKNSLLDHLRDFNKLEIYDVRGVLQFTMTKGVEK